MPHRQLLRRWIRVQRSGDVLDHLEHEPPPVPGLRLIRLRHQLVEKRLQHQRSPVEIAGHTAVDQHEHQLHPVDDRVVDRCFLDLIGMLQPAAKPLLNP
ncbi:hypothetical protein D3C81_1303230 [compost metagenome]